jgi:hypothetical protein
MARLFVILARNNRDAVIFRRGPTKQVLLIKWDRKNDSFEIGQWLKGRVYERRCDLSPSGKLLVYLAASWKGPIQSWTAISKPPYLTALALWPNLGSWGGGGLFEGELTLSLNHDVLHRKLANGILPKDMKVRPLGEDPGRGEDNSIYHMRLVRDGWNFVQAGKHRSREIRAVTADGAPRYTRARWWKVRLGLRDCRQQWRSTTQVAAHRLGRLGFRWRPVVYGPGQALPTAVVQ